MKLQYFGHLMRRVDSLEKNLMLGGRDWGQEEKGTRALVNIHRNDKERSASFQSHKVDLYLGPCPTLMFSFIPQLFNIRVCCGTL